ncbi:ubiquitin-related modifier 1 [Chiua virens]|nr:ubiquitin-related modifier 1 [Chiua virens]
MSDKIDLTIEFSGGLELLFGNQRRHTVSLPVVVVQTGGDDPIQHHRDRDGGTPPTVTHLIHHLRTHLLQERPELFIDGDTVYVVRLGLGSGCSHHPGSRPGILVLINDTDWELEGEGGYELKSGDEIVFISTLHGG